MCLYLTSPFAGILALTMICVILCMTSLRILSVDGAAALPLLLPPEEDDAAA